MNATPRRPWFLIGLYGAIAVCLASVVGCEAVDRTQDGAAEQAVGDMWRGEAAEPSWGR